MIRILRFVLFVMLGASSYAQTYNVFDSLINEAFIKNDAFVLHSDVGRNNDTTIDYSYMNGLHICMDNIPPNFEFWRSDIEGNMSKYSGTDVFSADFEKILKALNKEKFKDFRSVGMRDIHVRQDAVTIVVHNCSCVFLNKKCALLL